MTAKIECLAFRTQLGSHTFECIVVVPAKAVHQLKSEKIPGKDERREPSEEM